MINAAKDAIINQEPDQNKNNIKVDESKAKLKNKANQTLYDQLGGHETIKKFTEGLLVSVLQSQEVGTIFNFVLITQEQVDILSEKWI